MPSDRAMQHQLSQTWSAKLHWLDIVSDGIILLCLVCVLVALFVFLTKGRGVAPKWIFLCFASIILAGASALVLTSETLWLPQADVKTMVKGLMAAASIWAATTILIIMPSALALASGTELRRANAALTERIRERDRALLSLKEANRLLVLAEELGQVGHWRIEMPGHRRIWSPGIRRIFGIGLGDEPPPLEAVENGYHPDDRDRVRATLDTALHKGLPFSIETRVVRTDGEIRTVMIKGMSDGLASGTHVALFGVSIDITEQAQTLEALRLRERQLSAVLDNMPVLIAHWDRDLRNQLANRTFIDWHGLDPETCKGRTLASIVGEEAFAFKRPHIEAVLRGEPRRFEKRVRRRDGSERLVLATYIPDWQDGVVTGFYALVMDITDRKEAEDRLRASEAFLDKTGRVAGCGGWEIDLRSKAVRWSDQMRTIYGAGPDFEPSLEVTASFVPPEMRDLMKPHPRSGSCARDQWDMELPIETAQGRQLWIRSAGEVERHDDEDLRIIGIVQDITERKAIEQEREAGSILLEKARAAAEESRREAEQASAAKSEFLATISHEIRTPLNSIIGFTEVLLGSRAMSEPDRQTLRLVQSSGAALLTVVNDILDFSAMEAGRLKLASEPFSVRALVDNAVLMVSGAASQKGLAIEQTVAADVPSHVLGDENRLRQIILNFLINAVKFTPTGSITVSVERDHARAGDILFTVTDEGIGIASERHAELFQRFSQLDGSISRRYGGTGLGLAISKSLVEAMGGVIGVRSAEGCGSAFWFAVPLPPVQEPVMTVPREAVRAAPSTATRVLVIEDVELNQELVYRVLVAMGFRVDVASSGMDAIRLVQERCYDVVLMDIQMPAMDGVEATRQIRALDHPSRSVPIIAMTANVLPGQVETFWRVGMDGHIGKPFRQRELRDAIETALRARSGTCERDHAKILSEVGWDADATRELRTSIGDPAFVTLLGDFRALLAGLEDDPSIATREDLAQALAEVAAGADQLGFARLRDHAEAALAGLADGARCAAALSRFKAERGAVLAALDAIVAPAKGGGSAQGQDAVRTTV